MIKKSTNILLFFIFLLSQNILAQLINNQDCNAFTDEPFFNIAFITINTIKTIIGLISTKTELNSIKKSKLVMCFEFNKNGELEGLYRSVNKSNKIDTSFIDYAYSKSGKLITKRSNDSYGFYSYNYTLDSLGRIIKKTYCREKNIGKNRNDFLLGNKYVNFNESYSYKQTNSGYIKSVLNNNGRPYKRYEFVYDSLGYLRKEVKKLLINNKKSLVKYEYNEKGLLKSEEIFNNINDSEPNEKTIYKYDDLGNMTYIDKYKNKKHIIHKEMLYDKSKIGRASCRERV